MMQGELLRADAASGPLAEYVEDLIQAATL